MTVLVLFVEYFSRQFSLLQLVRSTGNRCSITKNGAIYYRPQRSWGKVIFSQASVILSTGSGLRGVCLVPGVWSWGGCLLGGGGLVPGGLVETTPGTATAADGTHPTGMHSCLNFFLQNPTFGYLPWPSQKLVSRTKRKTEKNQETPNPTKRPTLQNFDIRRALPVYISKFFGRANNKHFITASSYSNLYLICSDPNPRDSSTNIISKQNRQCFSCQNLVMFSTSNFTP